MELGENIHLLTKDFPKEEMFNLTSQIRRKQVIRLFKYFLKAPFYNQN